MDNLVSIIVPIYNGENSIRNCIESILNQTYQNIEIIVVDNNSNDKSAEIIRSYRNKKIRYLFEESPGVSFARNRGISNVSGVFVMFVDADDTLEKNIVEKYVNMMINNDNTQLIISDFNTNITNFNLTKRKINNNNDRIRTFELCLNDFRFQGFCWNKLFLVEIIQKNKIQFPTDTSILEDLYFCFSYISYIDNSTFINEKLYNYYQEDNSSAMFSFNFKSKVSALNVFEKIMQETKIKKSLTNREKKTVIFNTKSSLFLYALILYTNILKANKTIELEKDFLSIFRKNFLFFLFFSNIKIKYLISGTVVTLSPKLYKLILRGKI